jgi:hypothetical protein
MSPGGLRPHAGLMPETPLADLELAWKDRDAEAALLSANGFASLALALRLYSLEIRLKRVICRHLKLDYLPKSCKTHDLSELVIYTGLWEQLEDPANVDLFANWDRLANFSKKRLNDLRYQPERNLAAGEVQDLNSSLDDPTHGVLAWLSRHP